MISDINDDVEDQSTYHQRYHEVQKSDISENHINIKVIHVIFLSVTECLINLMDDVTASGSLVENARRNIAPG